LSRPETFRMATTPAPTVPAQRSLLARLLAQGVVAVIGLAIGAFAGLVGAFWLGLVAINC